MKKDDNLMLTTCHFHRGLVNRNMQRNPPDQGRLDRNNDREPDQGKLSFFSRNMEDKDTNSNNCMCNLFR